MVDLVEYAPRVEALSHPQWRQPLMHRQSAGAFRTWVSYVEEREAARMVMMRVLGHERARRARAANASEQGEAVKAPAVCRPHAQSEAVIRVWWLGDACKAEDAAWCSGTVSIAGACAAHVAGDGLSRGEALRKLAWASAVGRAPKSPPRCDAGTSTSKIARTAALRYT